MFSYDKENGAKCTKYVVKKNGTASTKKQVHPYRVVCSLGHPLLRMRGERARVCKHALV